MKDEKYTWTRPADCPAPTVVVEDDDCRTVTVVVTNPKDVTPAEATVTYGTDTKRLTVAPGTSAKATFPRRDGDRGHGGHRRPADDHRARRHPGLRARQARRRGRTTARAAAKQGGDEGGLPVTGPMAGAIAGGALALLVAGGVLYVLARRRRITFTP